MTILHPPRLGTPRCRPARRSPSLRTRWGLLALAALAVPLMAAPGHAEADPARFVGTWIDHTGRGAVEFTPCGNRLCGRIVWLKNMRDANGQPLTDGNNPDPSKRSASICGLQVIGDAVPQSDGRFDNGWIYDPERGERFSVELTSVSPNIITVRGYAGIKLFGETFTWRRAPAQLGRCSA